jgi:hypothetical protein
MSNDKRLFLSQIFKAYNQTKASALRAGDLKRVDRLNKALGILLSSNYYQDQKAAYQPSSTSCTCKDWEFRHASKRQYTGPCKHMLAAGLLLTGSTNFLFSKNGTRVSIPSNEAVIFASPLGIAGLPTQPECSQEQDGWAFLFPGPGC